MYGAMFADQLGVLESFPDFGFFNAMGIFDEVISRYVRMEALYDSTQITITSDKKADVAQI